MNSSELDIRRKTNTFFLVCGQIELQMIAHSTCSIYYRAVNWDSWVQAEQAQSTIYHLVLKPRGSSIGLVGPQVRRVIESKKFGLVPALQ